MNEQEIGLDLLAHGWSARGASFARGAAHLGDRSLDAAGIAQALESCESEAAWLALLRELNGSFAVVTRRGTQVLAAVDRVRSMPLFYGQAQGRRWISDSARGVSEKAQGWSLDAIADAEFQLTGYVTGSGTLLQGLHQVQAGEAVAWDAASGSDVKHVQYFTSTHADFFSDGPDALVDRLASLHERVFRRLLASVGDRPIAVPLSGGYDSRLIGVSLRDLGARNVVCYSYGVPGNWEARISQELARHLGFRWEFAPYSAQQWRHWAATDGFKAYCRAAGNLSSVPHVQDWAAVAELQRSGKLPHDSVFVPGHSGDFVAGSHIPEHFLARASISREEVLDAVLRSHYSLWDGPVADRRDHAAAFEQRIESIVGPIPTCSSEQAADLFERWDLQERQAKFIVNSVRVYEHFGHEWRLPLFDHELMDFWARVPVQWRVGRKLYYEFVAQRQRLPITSANTDRNALMGALVRGIEAAGLKPIAHRARGLYRSLRWRRDYESSLLAWNSIVDREFFGRTYTGKQLLHSYLALAYRDMVMERIGAKAGRRVIPAMAES